MIEEMKEEMNEGIQAVASNALFGSWFTGTPPHTKEGTAADYFLCLRIDSEVPCVLIYQHEEGRWTSGGGDTQRVLAWAHIPPKPNATGQARPQAKEQA